MLPSPTTTRDRPSAPNPPPFFAPAAPIGPAGASQPFESTASTTGSGQGFGVSRPVSSASGLHNNRAPGEKPVQLALSAQQQVTTTVVTTTRTTNYPPLLIPPPPPRHPSDPETYPLANALTPPCLKKFAVEAGGVSTSFRELEFLDQLGTFEDSLPISQAQELPRESCVLEAPSSFVDHPYPQAVQPYNRTGSRKRPVSPENYAAMTATELQQVQISPTMGGVSDARPKAPKRRGSIGASAVPPHLRSGSMSASKGMPGGQGNLGLPLTPFPEVNPINIPGDDISGTNTPNLPSPTMSPTTHANCQAFGPLLGEVPMLDTFDMNASGDAFTGNINFPPNPNLPADIQNIPSLNDIPYILNTFDSFPAQLKTYVLLQMLKRCPFPTLQFVSSMILPNLKRDFLGLLPVELSYQILQHLDLRSLGRCAQVSRAWKRVVDGDGAEIAIWKRRLQEDSWFDEAEVWEEADAYAKREGVPLRFASPDRRCLMQPDTRWALYWDAVNPTPVVAQDSLPPSLHKKLYRRHYMIRQNWFKGRYKRVTFPGHSFNVVTCLQFDCDKIVSGSDDQTIHIYDTATGNLLKRLQGHEGGVWALQYWKHVLVSGSTDRTVRVWDMDTGECTHLFEGHTSTVRCLVIIIPSRNPETGRMEPDVPLIVTGSRDATLRVWRLPNPKRDPPYHAGTQSPMSDPPQYPINPYFRHVLAGHTNSVRAIAGFGNTLVSGSYDTTVRIWDLPTGTCTHVCRGHAEKVYSVGYSHELKRAVSGSMDATVRIWCARTGQQLHKLEGHQSLVGLLELSSKYLVSAAADSTLRVWSPVTGQCLATLSGHAAAITCFHHDPVLNRIVSGSDGGVKLWELNSKSYGRGFSMAPDLGRGLPYTQGPEGETPIHGRHIRDLVSSVQGVWRVRMDERRMVCAVQKEGGRTWFEVLDFTEGVEGIDVQGVGDGMGDEMDEDDDDELDEDDDEMDEDGEEEGGQ
ncbi:SCF ubiquitin ligase complex subunit cdc4 [Gaertneriomyces sp. JEL0708]|nr:SCF ubiquitin ligase complex subunit cdc4 [Gaertneriomyces sp. JEL0708]